MLLRSMESLRQIQELRMPEEMFKRLKSPWESAWKVTPLQSIALQN